MKNSVLASIGLLGIVLLVFAIPFPHHVTCAFTIQPRDAQTVYIQHEAILDQVLVVPGQNVVAGQVIAKLKNVDDALKLEQLKAENREHLAELELRQQNRQASPKLTARISELKEQVRSTQDQIHELREVVDSFQVVAGRDGQIIPERTTSSKSSGSSKIQTFRGSPLAKENLGTWLTSGQKLCTIGDLAQFDAVLAVNEHDVNFVQTDQTAKLMLDSIAGTQFAGQVASVARKETEKLPASLAIDNGGSIQLAPSTQAGKPPTRPNDQHFEARVPILSPDVPRSNGLRGQAKIRVGSKTIFQRLSMLAYRSFRKKLN